MGIKLEDEIEKKAGFRCKVLNVTLGVSTLTTDSGIHCWGCVYIYSAWSTKDLKYVTKRPSRIQSKLLRSSDQRKNRGRKRKPEKRLEPEMIPPHTCIWL